VFFYNKTSNQQRSAQSDVRTLYKPIIDHHLTANSVLVISC